MMIIPNDYGNLDRLPNPGAAEVRRQAKRAPRRRCAVEDCGKVISSTRKYCFQHAGELADAEIHAVNTAKPDARLVDYWKNRDAIISEVNR